jgi:hypothetical protein
VKRKKREIKQRKGKRGGKKKKRKEVKNRKEKEGEEER